MYVCIYTRETRNVMCSVYLPNTILHKYKMYAGCRTLCRSIVCMYYLKQQQIRLDGRLDTLCKMTFCTCVVFNLPKIEKIYILGSDIISIVY